MSRAILLSALLAALVACEDGPKQIFTPNTPDAGVLAKQNGYDPTVPWTQDGDKGYDYTAGQGDSVDRARFCDEKEMTDTINTMVSKPMLPDLGMGGIKLWSKSGTPTHANDLVGRPEDGKFCDPDVYSNALVWGPTYEIIAFINEETKLVETLVATSGYQGKLEGQYTAADDSKVTLVLQMRERARIGPDELDKYTSSANQAKTKNSWLNHGRINEMYWMIRQAFFGAPKVPAAPVDCFDTSICGVIYTAADESQPQTTLVLFRDSGVFLAFSPEGQLIEVDLEPVKLAKFETSVSISALDATGKLAPKITSKSLPGCTLDLAAAQTFKDFQTGCVEAGDTRTLPRAAYDVYTQRDGVDVNFNGVSLSYLRRATKATLFKDGERPADGDSLYGLSFYRDLNAPVAEFIPNELGKAFKTRLEARVHALAAGSPGHPFATWTATVPALSTTAAPIGGLNYKDPTGGEVSVLDDAAAALRSEYDAMTPAQQQAASAVLHPVFVVEPLVDAVLAAFTNGKSDATDTFKGFLVTDDRRWSVGEVHFKQGGVPMRVTVQYSLNYGAITAVTFERGASQVDEQYQTLAGRLIPSAAYYGIEMSYHVDADGNPANPLGLDGEGIVVKGSDRKLNMVDITLKVTGAALELTTPGALLSDQAGFQKQIRGERWEFVPAHKVALLGKETALTFYVTETRLRQGEGTCTAAAGCVVQSVAAVGQSYYKKPLQLCTGLEIAFGDDVRAAVDAWTVTVGSSAARQCEVVFNYSANGNVLASVVSLANKIQFATDDGRATSVFLWK